MTDLGIISPSKPVILCFHVPMVAFVEFDIAALVWVRRLGEPMTATSYRVADGSYDEVVDWV
jgi:hypothetical protein